MKKHTASFHLPGIVFNEPTLLQTAFIHRSYCKIPARRANGLPSNERLEFLGDSVLNFLSSSYIYVRFPAYSEGELSVLRSSLVRTNTLARFARQLALGQHIRLSRSEDTPANRNRESLLADVFEAVLGAIFLDQGIDVARSFIEPLLEQEVERILSGGDIDVDYRTQLQQLVQAQSLMMPTYQITQVSGPDHRRQFTIDVLCGDECLGTGSGLSKQSAAQQAARKAVETLQQRAHYLL